MIARTATDLLISRYGDTADGRRSAREFLIRQITERGHQLIKRETATAGRTHLCGGEHHDLCGSGANCLCECHDPEGAQP